MHGIRRCGVLIAVASMLAGAASLYADRGSAEAESVCVVAATAQARVGDRVVETLPRGTVFRVDQKKVELLWSNRLRGWVRQGEVLPLNEAILLFGRELRARPQDPLLHRARALARSAKAGSLGKDGAPYLQFALEDINRCLELAPNDAAALCLRGDILMALEGEERALADLDRATVLAPSDDKPRLLRAEHWIDQNNADRAAAELAAISRSTADVWMLRCKLHLLQKDEASALADLNRALACNPYRAELYVGRARLHLAVNALPLATADAEAALRLDRCDANAWAVRADCLAKSGQRERAIGHYSRAIALDPSRAEFYVGRGTAHFESRVKTPPPAVSVNVEFKSDAKAGESVESTTQLEGIGSGGGLAALSLGGLKGLDSKNWFDGSDSVPAVSPVKTADGQTNGTETTDLMQGISQGQTDTSAVAARADFAEACRLSPRDPEVLAKAGQLLTRLSDFDSAIAMFDEAVALRPDLGPTYCLRGLCRQSMREYDCALADFDRAVEVSPDSLEVRLTRAHLRLESQHLRGAEEDARFALERDPNSALACKLLIIALSLQARGDEALVIARESKSLTRAQRGGLMAMAWTLEGEHHRGARALWEHRAAESSISWYDSQRRPGWAFDPEKLRTAYATFTPAARHDAEPTVPMLRLRGDLAMRTGHFREAIVEYGHAIAGCPANSRLWVRRARAYRSAHDEPRAAADLKQALAIAPQSSSALAARAELAIDRGQFNPALDDCHAALRFDPESAEALVQLARLWRLEGHLEQSLSDSDAALSLNRNLPEAHREQGHVFLARGDDEAARQAFRRCLELQLADADAHFGIAEVYRQHQQQNMAIQHYREALASNPRLAEALGGRGLAWLHEGDRALAAADFAAALEINPDELRALTGRGELRMSRGEYAPAVADLRRALRLNPDCGEAAEMLAWILSACPQAELRDGRRAVVLAEQAVRDRPTCDRLQALAAAHAEAGDFEAATSIEKRALEAAPPFARQEFEDRLAQFAKHQPVRLEVREPDETEPVPVPEAEPDVPFQP